MVLVSVIIPTYNREKTVGKAIDSVLCQTFEDFELIVVDDGSIDGTERIVRSYADPRVRFLRAYEGNRGPAAARNSGIEASLGRYIAFQDSDDEWVPEKLAIQIETMRRASDQTGVVYGTILRKMGDSEERLPRENAKKSGRVLDSLLEGNLVGTPVAMVKSDLLRKVGGFDTSLRSIEDWDLFLRLSEVCDFEFIDRVLCVSTELQDSVNANTNRWIDSLAKFLEKHKALYARNRRALMGFYLEIGRVHLKRGEGGKGKEFVKKAFRAYPWSASPFFLRLASLFGVGVLGKASNFVAKAEGRPVR